MAKSDITREDVLKAVAEFDELTREVFLEKYKMGEASSYFLRHGGKDYDSKAILAAAHGHHDGLRPLRSEDFSGGTADTVKWLRRLGFEVHSQRAPDWVRDEIILACDLLRENGWKWMSPSDPRAKELSELLQLLPIHPMEVRGPKFRNPNGVVRKMQDIQVHLPGYPGVKTNGNVLDRQVLQDFLDHEAKMRAVAQSIRDGLQSGKLLEIYDTTPDLDDLEGEAPEGRLLERNHFARERNSKLRERKIKQHLLKHDNLACEVCGFDFRATYGERGDGYIECHHVVPLHASGETRTSIKDLILICANCHRMVHRRNPWLVPEELRLLVRRTLS
ncbi:HNH endonuclease [Rhodococcus aetherivorans]|uniref:HNH endonuclease n=1 Tax=Rhodococcus aetherivorans TaxID=191292 RepID=UPI0031D1F5AD